jgi:hypothetical protein
MPPQTWVGVRDRLFPRRHRRHCLFLRHPRHPPPLLPEEQMQRQLQPLQNSPVRVVWRASMLILQSFARCRDQKDPRWAACVTWRRGVQAFDPIALFCSGKKKENNHCARECSFVCFKQEVREVGCVDLFAYCCLLFCLKEDCLRTLACRLACWCVRGQTFTSNAYRCTSLQPRHIKHARTLATISARAAG